MEIKSSTIFLILCVGLEGILAEPEKPFVYRSGSKRIVLAQDNTIDKERVNIRNYPWLVVVQALSRNNQWYAACGGSLITANFVLTAHHCLPKSKNPKEISVKSYVTNKLDAGIFHEVTDIIQHPQGDYVPWDITLLKIKPRVQFRGEDLPIQMFTGQVRPGTTGVILGWGDAHVEPKVSVNYLRRQEVTIMDDDSCEKQVTPRGFFARDNMMCIQPKGLGTCAGDSGGPLIVGGKLAGVVNGGGCESLTHPSRFTNVSYHSEWITKSMETYYMQHYGSPFDNGKFE